MFLDSNKGLKVLPSIYVDQKFHIVGILKRYFFSILNCFSKCSVNYQQMKKNCM